MKDMNENTAIVETGRALDAGDEKAPASAQKRITQVVAAVAIILLIWAMLQHLVVVTHSMEPTIRAGDHVIASPLTYLFREPARGDIVVFKPCKNISEEYWIHRIIAVGGDSVTQENGRLKVNEQSISFDQTIQKGNRKVHVPAGQYYQKGDNINSIEGLIDKSYVKSKVLWTFRLPGMTSIVFLVLILYIAIHGNILFGRLSRLCANRTGQYMIDNFVLCFPNKRRAFLEQFKDDKEVMDAFLRFKKFYWQMTIILLMLALVKFLQFVI